MHPGTKNVNFKWVEKDESGDKNQYSLEKIQKFVKEPRSRWSISNYVTMT